MHRLALITLLSNNVYGVKTCNGSLARLCMSGYSANTVDGLQRGERRFGHSWQMVPANGGRAALQ